MEEVEGLKVNYCWFLNDYLFFINVFNLYDGFYVFIEIEVWIIDDV